MAREYWKVEDRVFNDYDNSFYEVIFDTSLWRHFDEWLSERYTTVELFHKMTNSINTHIDMITDEVYEEFVDYVYDNRNKYDIETWHEEEEDKEDDC